MSKTRKKRISGSLITAVAVTSFLLSMSSVALAAGTNEPKIDNMTISIMPDYDDPRVLVVLQPILSSDTNLPSTVKFPVSAKEENLEIGMACEVIDGNHSCKSYTTEKASDFNELSFTVNSSRNVFLEYYWDAFQGAKDNVRTFTYDYKAPYSIKQLTIAIQEPKKSTGFKVEPASSDIQTDQEGLKGHVYSFTDVKAGQILSFKVDYQSGGTSKPVSDKPLASDSSDQAGAAGANAGGFNGSQALTIIFLAAVMFVVFSFIYRRSQATTQVAAAVRPSSLNHKKKGSAAGHAKPRFCSSCGESYGSNTGKFCTGCGQKII